MTVRPSLGSACALGVLLVGLTCRVSAAAETFVFHHEDVMGTSMELRLVADSEAIARRAEDCALREIDRLSAIFSSYDPGSEFSRWMAGPRTPVRIAPELFEVLELADRWRTASGGAFEPRIEALMRLWSRCAKEGRTPTPAEIDAARSAMGPAAWRLDTAAMTAERLSDCPISLNAIAKGYIVERAGRAAMDEGGIRGVLLNVGGDLRVFGALDRTLAIADPRADSETSPPIAYLEVRDKAVSTSGRSQRGFRIGGKWYSHKLDPRSGRPVERVASATVIADRSADADALATIFNVLPPEDSVRLARTIPGVECLIVATDGVVTRSDGWGRFERPGLLAMNQPAGLDGKPEKPAPAAAGPSWGDAFELFVKLEINRPTTAKRRYQRPYLAVWVEDKDGHSVRTLVLWIQGNRHGSRWIPDLRRWYRGDQDRRKADKTDLVATIARPTREPGKYEIIWDGKDDQGKPVGRGEYTLSIEAAREHGTYQIIRQAIPLDDRPFARDLKGNVEIKAATVEIRRRTGTPGDDKKPVAR
jgi:thiamine biosynthesis lipoprotein ApbE